MAWSLPAPANATAGSISAAAAVAPAIVRRFVRIMMVIAFPPRSRSPSAIECGQALVRRLQVSCRRVTTRHEKLMEFRVLGPVEVEKAGCVLVLGGPKPRALLAILLLQRGEVVRAERLVELLYDGLPPEKAPKSVQAHVSRLRKALGDGRLRTAGGGYALDVSPDELDLGRFEQLVERGRAALAASEPEPAAT